MDSGLTSPAFAPSASQEEDTRSRMLPILKITTDQLDGTIKPKFSQFSKSNSAAANMEHFGNAFYEVRARSWRRRLGCKIM